MEINKELVNEIFDSLLQLLWEEQPRSGANHIDSDTPSGSDTIEEAVSDTDHDESGEKDGNSEQIINSNKQAEVDSTIDDTDDDTSSVKQLNTKDIHIQADEVSKKVARYILSETNCLDSVLLQLHNVLDERANRLKFQFYENLALSGSLTKSFEDVLPSILKSRHTSPNVNNDSFASSILSINSNDLHNSMSNLSISSSPTSFRTPTTRLNSETTVVDEEESDYGQLPPSPLASKSLYQPYGNHSSPHLGSFAPSMSSPSLLFSTPMNDELSPVQHFDEMQRADVYAEADLDIMEDESTSYPNYNPAINASTDCVRNYQQANYSEYPPIVRHQGDPQPQQYKPRQPHPVQYSQNSQQMQYQQYLTPHKLRGRQSMPHLVTPVMANRRHSSSSALLNPRYAPRKSFIPSTNYYPEFDEVLNESTLIDSPHKYSENRSSHKGITLNGTGLRRSGLRTVQRSTSNSSATLATTSHLGRFQVSSDNCGTGNPSHTSTPLIRKHRSSIELVNPPNSDNRHVRPDHSKIRPVSSVGDIRSSSSMSTFSSTSNSVTPGYLAPTFSSIMSSSDNRRKTSLGSYLATAISTSLSASYITTPSGHKKPPFQYSGVTDSSNAINSSRAGSRVGSRTAHRHSMIFPSSISSNDDGFL